MGVVKTLHNVSPPTQARKYKFAFDKRGHGVEIMDGLSEALFGWVTINYLQRLLTKPSTQTAVVLDLGSV